jgi:hypothetical protein
MWKAEIEVLHPEDPETELYYLDETVQELGNAMEQAVSISNSSINSPI